MSLVSEIALKIKQKKRLGRFTVVVVLLKKLHVHRIISRMLV